MEAEASASALTLEHDFAHPAHLIEFLIFHEGYHHGQIKLALSVFGSLIPNDVAGGVMAPPAGSEVDVEAIGSNQC